jgi:hypothetical protein
MTAAAHDLRRAFGECWDARLRTPFFPVEFAMPEVGLEPTRPCGQRILSANRTRGQVALMSRLYEFLGNGACGSARDSYAGTPAPNTLPNSFGALGNRRQAASLITSKYARPTREQARSRSAWNALAAVVRCSGARVLRTPSHVKESFTAAIVMRRRLAAMRSSWVVGVVVGWDVDRLVVCRPVSWEVVVAVDTKWFLMWFVGRARNGAAESLSPLIRPSPRRIRPCSIRTRPCSCRIRHFLGFVR